MPRKTSLELFVAGVAAYSNESELLAYLNRFGVIADLQVTFNSKSKKRIFRATAQDQETYMKILEHPCHILKGRTLQISPFVSGSDLKKVNSKMNNCRVILKRVPPDLTASDLAARLQSEFGAVHCMFCFESDTMGCSQGSYKRKLSYSVLFKHELSALKAVTARYLVLPPNILVSVERYSYLPNQSAGNDEAGQWDYKGLHSMPTKYSRPDMGKDILQNMTESIHIRVDKYSLKARPTSKLYKTRPLIATTSNLRFNYEPKLSRMLRQTKFAPINVNL